jgi:putative Mg2+ transporter-C (MgtC) family protein
MDPYYARIAGGIAAAWLAGALIGAERTFHGRAGFRTHALVALASATAMLVVTGDAAATSRVAQGVMTGIGFVGAGVIFKEGVSMRGLTTAASMWATAAIGLLLGAGDYTAGGLATGAVLATLIVLRWIEEALPTRVYAWSTFRFRAEASPDLPGLAALLAKHGVTLRDVSYCRSQGGTLMEFKGVVAAGTDRAFDDLAASLMGVDSLPEFELSRISK